MTSPINVVIIDDEPGCVDNLRYNLAAWCPDIRVVATGQRLSDISNLQGHTPVDIVFLDIELFHENVFDTISSISTRDYRIVFVTAYNQYAINAFRVDALDYMLKPLDKEDLLACYRKIQKWKALSHARDIAAKPPQKPKQPQSIALRQGDKMYLVQIADILYLEAKGFYTKVAFLYQGVKHDILISKLLSKVEEEYANEYFFRVHKSFIVNVSNLNTIIRHGALNVEMKTGDIIPVAKRRAHEFISYIQSNSHR